ncbi:MAG: S8 family serine peptidase [Bacillota bacterium]|nr:S8 family serine peptidase [Bacillota bacterium]
MKRNVKKVIVLLLILSLLVPGYGLGAYAASKQNVQEPNVNEVNSLELISHESLNLELPQILGDYDFNSAERVKVIVELKEESIIAAKHNGKSQTKQNLERVRKDVIAKINQVVVGAKISREYDYLVSGFSIEVESKDLPKLIVISGIKAIYPNVTYTTAEVGAPKILSDENMSPVMFDSAPFIGAPEAWDLGFKGEGITVAVIDTGVDYNHPSLAHAFGSYKGYDFFDNDNDPMEVEGEYHGTHVSGTIAGYNEADGFSGIAPEATLLGYRVLGPDGGTSEDVIAGIEKAVMDGANVMNLSLGNSLNAPDYMTSIALDEAMKEGVIVVTSNGNSGPDNWTVGSPGTSREAISVGATMQPYKTYTSEITVSDGIDYPTAVMGFNTEEALYALNSGSYDIVYGELGYPADLDSAAVSGKAVLIQRGELAFVDKAENAKNAGAIAVLIYDHTSNNVMPDIPGMAVPTFKLTKEVGEMMAATLSKSKTGLTIEFNIQFDKNVGETMADFSSRGPVVNTWMIKPDLSAPGVDVVSSVPGGYASLQGTSMASPHVAGAAALVLQAHPNYSPEDVKAALMNTAVTVYEPLSTNPYPLNSQGAGSIRIVEAIEADVLVSPGSNSLGVFYPGEEPKIIEKSFRVSNDSVTPIEASIAVSFEDNSLGEIYEVSNSVQVDAESSSEFVLKITIDPTDLDPGYYEGEIVLSYDSQSFNIPLIFFIGEPDYPIISHAGLDVVDGVNYVWGFVPMGADELEIALFKEVKGDLVYVGTTHYFENVAADIFEYEWDGKLNGSKLKPGNYYMVAFATKNGATEYLIAANFVTPTTKGKK